MKYEDKSIANRSILWLYLSVSSGAPNPSLSSTKTSTSYPTCSAFKVYLHIHNPLVQELMVGDTLKVLFLRRTLLRNRDFPVRYLPTIDMTPRGFLNCLRNYPVSGGTSNFPSLYLMSWRGELILTFDI